MDKIKKWFFRAYAVAGHVSLIQWLLSPWWAQIVSWGLGLVLTVSAMGESMPWFLAVPFGLGTALLSLMLLGFVVERWPWKTPASVAVPVRGRGEHQGRVPVARDEDLIPMPDAARTVYAEARMNHALLARAAEQMSSGEMRDGTPDEVLDYMATYIGGESRVFGARPPSDRRELIDAGEVTSGQFEDGALVLKTHRHVYNDLAVRRQDFANVVLGLKADALSGLAALRASGVALRNELPVQMTDAQLQAWIDSTRDWMRRVSTALGPVNKPDSEWFLTLDTVPASRIPIPNIQLGGLPQREAFVSHFLQHDYRLARLNDLLKKYGVGA